ncbi:MAG TPA: MerR family DNA-binding transcriptional regulator [Rhodopila sp.]|jgi:DNA-binding transcriptional MerR regulator|nr:MerR family DNA-binding transcriptional regulator [Rhodopila sp.]
MGENRLFTVTELAKDLGMTARAIRFYEDKGLITPQRAGTTRVYSARDRARMILIQRGKRLGFSLSTIKDYLDLYNADVTHRAQRQLLLVSVSKRREQLLAQRHAIDEALSELAEIAAQTEAALKTPSARLKRAASG